jgi:hypothetical protein
MTSIRDAVENVYLSFKDVTLVPPLNTGDQLHRLSESVSGALCSLPLRKITAELLSDYNNALSDMQDMGFENQFRYFLPRYLDLIAQGSPPDCLFGLSTCLRHLGRLDWVVRWPHVQALAVFRFLDCFFLWRLKAIASSRDPNGRADFSIDELLSFLATSGYPIKRALALWDKIGDPDAAIAMAWLRQNVSNENGLYFVDNIYLSELDRFCVGNFLMRPDVDARIEASVFKVEDSHIQQILSDALWRK